VPPRPDPVDTAKRDTAPSVAVAPMDKVRWYTEVVHRGGTQRWYTEVVHRGGTQRWYTEVVHSSVGLALTHTHTHTLTHTRAHTHTHTHTPHSQAHAVSASNSAPLRQRSPKANIELVKNVHPPDYVNAVPADEYDLVVIGSGVAGLLSVMPFVHPPPVSSRLESLTPV
jgi:hypothetical protein